MLKIVTDSTAYLPEDYVRKHDIRVVPLYVHFGNEAFKDGVDLSHDEFYARLAEARDLPTSSQPSAGEFHAVFEDLANKGHDIIVLTISSKLSGTWDSAMAAKQMLPEANIEVVDTLTTSVGLHLLVQAAIEAAAGGATLQEAAELVEDLKGKIYLWFVVDTLEYLAKGGRIGNARAFMGTLLKVKPILTLQDGAIEPCEQVRSTAKARARMVELVVEAMGERGCDATISIASALVPEDAQKLGNQLVQKLECAEPLQGNIGPVLGVHTGPGVIGVAAYV